MSHSLPTLHVYLLSWTILLLESFDVRDCLMTYFASKISSNLWWSQSTSMLSFLRSPTRLIICLTSTYVSCIKSFSCNFQMMSHSVSKKYERFSTLDNGHFVAISPYFARIAYKDRHWCFLHSISPNRDQERT